MCSTRSDKDRSILDMASSSKNSALTIKKLTRRWRCRLELAKNTLKLTTQFGIRNVIHPYDKWYKTTYDHMRLPTLTSTYYSDLFFSKIKSIRDNNAAQDCTDEKDSSNFYPLERKSLIGRSLVSFIHYVGVPTDLVTDGDKRR